MDASRASSPAPKVHDFGDQGPPCSDRELRRHVYKREGVPAAIKIKLKDGGFTQWYRVHNGWQARKPEDYSPVPYVPTGIDPFDPEYDQIFWPEGEKDVDTLGKLNLATFTYGGVGDGLTEDVRQAILASQLLLGRHVVVLADNDKVGRKHAEAKAELADQGGAASVRIVHFLELKEKGDVSDFVARGGSAADLIARIAAAPAWQPPPVTSSHTTAEQSVGRELVICRASEIEPEPISWLWPGRIAIGKQTLAAGEPGLGKSQLATFIASTVSTGGDWPGDEGRAPLGNVVILSAEDGVTDTIVPRLIAAGANRERVFVISAVRNEDGGGRRTFNLQADLSLLEHQLATIGDVRLVIIDPISSYMGNIDSHKNTDVRGVLEAVGEMATRHGVAVLGVTHFSKGAGQKAINAFIGSVAFIAAARAAFAVMKDPDDQDRRLFLPVKNNLAPLGHGLAFRLTQHLVATTGGDAVASAVSWESAPVTITADGVMAANAGGDIPHTAKSECVEFLQNVLAGGWMEVADIAAEAISAGLHSDGKELKDNKPMRTARSTLRIETKRMGFGKGARYFWAFPGTPWAPSTPMGAHSNNGAPMDLEGAHGAVEGSIQ
jgi:putative DNA primase/helicase